MIEYSIERVSVPKDTLRIQMWTKPESEEENFTIFEYYLSKAAAVQFAVDLLDNLQEDQLDTVVDHFMKKYI